MAGQLTARFRHCCACPAGLANVQRQLPATYIKPLPPPNLALGVPVVPLVYMMVQTSSALGGAASMGVNSTTAHRLSTAVRHLQAGRGAAGRNTACRLQAPCRRRAQRSTACLPTQNSTAQQQCAPGGAGCSRPSATKSWKLNTPLRPSSPWMVCRGLRANACCSQLTEEALSLQAGGHAVGCTLRAASATA